MSCDTACLKCRTSLKLPCELCRAAFNKEATTMDSAQCTAGHRVPVASSLS